MSETIFAVATARGKAGVAIVRVSGAQAPEALRAFGVPLVATRRASLRKLSVAGAVIDEALVLVFAENQSFTGEAVVEFQLHGSVAVTSAVLRVLSDIPGFRHAEAGEFTRRALENGVLDLTQVEGLADLIDAETEAQRRQAQRVLSGAIGLRAAEWRRDLIRASALIEATIDFADEDVPVNVVPEVLALIDGLRESFRRELEAGRVAERIRDGFEVALIGSPNAGKSSLLNALVGRDAAITSAVAGTTRDVLEVRMDLGGLPVTMLDTAGLRETDDEVEVIGVARARARAGDADLRVLLVDPTGDRPAFDLLEDDIVVETKADLFPGEGRVSSKTGEGLDALISRIEGVLQQRVPRAGVIIRERQRIALLTAVEALDSAKNWLYSGGDAVELVASDLRSAVHALDLLVGRIGVETLLDEIFASFCIGK